MLAGLPSCQIDWRIWRAPQYLADDLHRVAEFESRRRLRSAATAALIVAATARSTIGDRAFSVAAAQKCNSLSLRLGLLAALERCCLDGTSKSFLHVKNLNYGIICG